MTYEGHDARLLKKVCDYLRVNSADPSIMPLITAAQQYLEGAGVPAPVQGAPTEQYDLAVILYVNTIYNGGEDKLEGAMTSLVLQLRA